MRGRQRKGKFPQTRPVKERGKGEISVTHGVNENPSNIQRRLESSSCENKSFDFEQGRGRKVGRKN